MISPLKNSLAIFVSEREVIIISPLGGDNYKIPLNSSNLSTYKFKKGVSDMKEITKRTRESGLAWPGSLGRLHEEMDRMFNRFFGELRPMEVVGSFVVDVNEDDKHIYIKAEMPGMTKEDTELTVENGLLTISGEKVRETLPGHEDLQERYYGRIYRSLTLPSSVNEKNVKATMKDGILNIVLDKIPESKPSRIPIE